MNEAKNRYDCNVIKGNRRRVMASEPLFEERSDTVKVSETPYPTNGAVRIWHKMQVLNVLTCVRTLTPFASLCSALPSVFGGS